MVYNKKTYLVINVFFLSTFFVSAQEFDFQKQIINESVNPKIMLQMSDSLSLLHPRNEPVKLEIDPAKIKIPMHATFDFRLDSLHLTVPEDIESNQYTISPYLMASPTNRKMPFYESYDETLVFIDGKWVPESSLVGIGVFGVLKKIMPFNDPVVSRPSKKQKALQRIKLVYNME